MQKETLFEQVKPGKYAGEGISNILNMGRQPIKSHAEFLRNRKVISGNQRL